MNATEKFRRDVLKILLDNVEVFEHDLDLVDLSYREKYKPYVEMLKKIKQQTSKQIIMKSKQYSNIPHEFELLLRDFNSSQTPDPNDPMTIKALDKVAVNIYNDKYTLSYFNDFADTSLCGGYFADACKKYVANNLNGAKQ